MRRLKDLAFRLRALLFQRGMERDLDDEMAFHLDMETRKLIDQGLTPEAAAREARVRFGGVEQQQERTRDAWGIGFLADLVTDVRHAGRQFRRRLGFSSLAILTLALGIGATVALFSVVIGLLVRPLPVADEDRLRIFWSDYNWRGVEFDHVKGLGQSFDGIAAYSSEATPFQSESGTRLLPYTVSSAELFDVLGVRPVLGRTFLPGEDRPGAEPVIVIGWGMWQQDLGGDPDILGKRIQVGGRPTTVIGVMPRGFWFPTPEFRAWLPLDLDPAGSTYQNNGWLVLIGRQKSTATPAAVTGDLQTFTRALGERFTYPEAWDKTKDAHLRPLREYLLGDVEPTMLLLLGAVGLLLLMACTNAAALILARTTDRTGEMAVRTALGAGRGRLARQILTESITLALVAGVVGAAVAVAIFDMLVASLPLQSGFGDTLSLDWTTFATAFALALLVGLAVSAIPVRHLLQGRLDGAISGERSEAGLRRGAGRAHAVLVTAEVMLAVLLAVGATLLIRTVDRIRALDPGFDPAHVVTLDLVASAQDMDPEVRWNFFRELLTRIEALPGVGAAGYTNRLPVRDGGWQGPVTIESRPDLADAKRPNSLFRWATPGFFETMGIEIEHGRGIEAADRRGAVPVALVSESFAQKMWPGREALGQRIMLTVVGEPDWRTVVGVFEETRMVSMLGENPMVFYIPFEQSPFPGEGQALVIRAEGDPAGVVAAVRRLVGELDPRVAVAHVAPMEDVVATALAEPLRLRFFLSLFAGLALLLGTVGVYGVVSYSVGRRRAEFGIRMALGAAPGRVIGDVVRGGMLPVGVGVLAGLLASIALSRVVGRFLFQIAPTDPLSLATAGLALLGAGVLAALVPAWRAGRVSPVEALRAE